MTLYNFLFGFSNNISFVEVRIFNLMNEEVFIQGSLFDILDRINNTSFMNDQVVSFEYSRSGLFVDVFSNKPL